MVAIRKILSVLICVTRQIRSLDVELGLTIVFWRDYVNGENRATHWVRRMKRSRREI